MSDDLVASTGDSGSTASAGSSSPTAVAEPVESSSTGALDQSTEPAQPGPIPYERFKDVNDRYARVRWAEGHDPHTIQQQQAFFQWLDRDPVGAFRYMQDYLGRAGVLRSANDTPDEARPTPSIRIPETGQQFYTAADADKLVEWALAQRDQRLEPRLQTIEATFAEQRARAVAGAQIAEAETWPHYKEHESHILQAMEADHRLSLEGAYRRVVLPRLRQLERAAVLEEMKTKPNASTHNPGAAGATNPQPVSKLGWVELFRREMGKRR